MIFSYSKKTKGDQGDFMYINFSPNLISRIILVLLFFLKFRLSIENIKSIILFISVDKEITKNIALALSTVC